LKIELGGDRLQACVDGGDSFLERRGSGGEADGFCFSEPGGVEFVGALDVVDAEAGDGAGGDKLKGVVAVAPTDDDQRVALGEELAEGGLAVFRRLTDGVGEADLGGRTGASERVDESMDAIDRLGGLRNHAVALVRGEFDDGGLIFQDKRTGEIAGEARDFDMAALADDDGKVAEFDQQPELIMGMANQRAGAVGDAETGATPCGAGVVRSAVSGDHDLCGGGAGHVVEAGFAGAAGGEPIADDGVVDEFTEDGERGSQGETFRLGDGVADAEAEAVVLG